MDFFGKTIQSLFVYLKAEGRKKFSLVKALGAEDGILHFIDYSNPVLPEAFNSPFSLTPQQRSAIYEFHRGTRMETSACEDNLVYVLDMSSIFNETLCDDWHAIIDVSLNASNASTHWQHIE